MVCRGIAFGFVLMLTCVPERGYTWTEYVRGEACPSVSAVAVPVHRKMVCRGIAFTFVLFVCVAGQLIPNCTVDFDKYRTVPWLVNGSCTNATCPLVNAWDIAYTPQANTTFEEKNETKPGCNFSTKMPKTDGNYVYSIFNKLRNNTQEVLKYYIVSPQPPQINCSDPYTPGSSPGSQSPVGNNIELLHKQGQISHCTCWSQNDGNPSAAITWFVNDKQLGNDVREVDLEGIASGENNKFECRMEWSDRLQHTSFFMAGRVHKIYSKEGHKLDTTPKPENGKAANVTTFTADGQSGSRKVQQGSSVHIDCQATGTPEPNVSITDNAGVVMEPQLNNLTLDFNVTGKCDTTHSLACRADNGVLTSEKTIVLFVECDTTDSQMPLYIGLGSVVFAIVLVLVTTIIFRRRKGKHKRESQSREIRTDQSTSQRRTSCSNNTEPQHSHRQTPRDVTPPTRHVTFPANPVHGPIPSASIPFMQIVIPNDRLGIQIVPESPVMRSCPELRDDARPGLTEPRPYDNASHLGSQRALHFDGSQSQSFETSQNLTVANNSEFIPLPDYQQDTPVEEYEPGGEREQ